MNCIECGMPCDDRADGLHLPYHDNYSACLAALRARIAALTAQLAAADRVVEAAFKAIQCIWLFIGSDRTMPYSDDLYKAAQLTSEEARRLRAELEGK